MLIRELYESEYSECENILRSLPKWFGREESIIQYVKDLSTTKNFAVEVNSSLAGFAGLVFNNKYTVDINIMAIREEYQNQKLGTALIDHIEEFLRKSGYEYLEVKTLGPSHPSKEYEATRKFYESVGFRPVEEFMNLWGEGYSCQVMIKKV